MAEESTVIHKWEKSDPTKKVKLMKMSKSYQWEITYEHTDNALLLKEIGELDKALHEEYDTKEDN